MIKVKTLVCVFMIQVNLLNAQTIGAPVRQLGANGLGIAGITTANQCCDVQQTQVKLIQRRVDFLENDLGNKFKDQFKVIDS